MRWQRRNERGEKTGRKRKARVVEFTEKRAERRGNRVDSVVLLSADLWRERIEETERLYVSALAYVSIC